MARTRSTRSSRGKLPHELAGYRHARPDELRKGAVVYAWAAQPECATPSTVIGGPKDLRSFDRLTPHYLIRYVGRSSMDDGWTLSGRCTSALRGSLGL